MIAILAAGSPTKHFTRVSFHFIVYIIFRLFSFKIHIKCFVSKKKKKIFVFVYSIKPFSQQPYGGKPATAISGEIDAGHPSAQASWEGRAIATSKFRLLEFSAFMEVQREEVVSLKYLKKKIVFKIKSIVNLLMIFLLYFHSIAIYSFTSMAKHHTPIHYLR